MVALTLDDCAASRAPGRLIRRIERLMSALIEARFPVDGISFSQWIALKLIEDGVVATPGELARDLGHTTGSVTRLVDSLEARGFLMRSRDGSDRRTVRLQLTEAGNAQMLALADTVVGTWNELLADFGRDEFEALVASLTKLMTRAERKLVDDERREAA
ncbi:MAG: MarR family transcriptional regulator [Sphingomonadaceae bacterium]|nr:MarR family transcriptional regulator [Sphingomonadaceae bacterium]